MRRASSSVLASGCAFATTACRLSASSDDPAGPFSAALNRLGDEMRTDFGRLDANVKAEMNDVRTQLKAFDANVKAEMRYLTTSITSDTHSWFKMNERIIHASIAVVFVALAYAMNSSLVLEEKMLGLRESMLKAVCAIERAKSAGELLATAPR